MRVKARSHGTGIEVEDDFVGVLTFRDGLVVRHEVFGDEAEARRASGLG